MAKKGKGYTITFYLSDEIIRKINIANPNKSDEARKAFRAWYARMPSLEELQGDSQAVSRAKEGRQDIG
jgi:hypothetical protein